MIKKGNYAVAVVWSDGHKSSIYPYDRLKSSDIEGELKWIYNILNLILTNYLQVNYSSILCLKLIFFCFLCHFFFLSTMLRLHRILGRKFERLDQKFVYKRSHYFSSLSGHCLDPLFTAGGYNFLHFEHSLFMPISCCHEPDLSWNLGRGSSNHQVGSHSCTIQ